MTDGLKRVLVVGDDIDRLALDVERALRDRGDVEVVVVDSLRAKPLELAEGDTRVRILGDFLQPAETPKERRKRESAELRTFLRKRDRSVW